jgi:hypothetical protein
VLENVDDCGIDDGLHDWDVRDDFISVVTFKTLETVMSMVGSMT